MLARARARTHTQVDILPNSPGREKLGQPGPGHYEPYLADNMLSLDKLRHSSMFSRSTVDRFGQPVEPKGHHVQIPGMLSRTRAPSRLLWHALALNGGPSRTAEGALGIPHRDSMYAFAH